MSRFIYSEILGIPYRFGFSVSDTISNPRHPIKFEVSSLIPDFLENQNRNQHRHSYPQTYQKLFNYGWPRWKQMMEKLNIVGKNPSRNQQQSNRSDEGENTDENRQSADQDPTNFIRKAVSLIIECDQS